MTPRIDALWRPAEQTKVTIRSPLNDSLIALGPIAVVTFPEWEGYYRDVVWFGYADEKLPQAGSWDPGHGWWLSVHDEAGAEYESSGGASGLSEDKTKAEGELDFEAPASKAKWLDLVFHWEADRPTRSPHRSTFRLRVVPPLPLVTFAQWVEMLRDMSEVHD
jgi:hypothetical protein